MHAGGSWKARRFQPPVGTSCALKMLARFLTMMDHAQFATKCSQKGDKFSFYQSTITRRKISIESATIIVSIRVSSHMRPVDINPADEWTNMAMVGVSPQILMKSAYRSVMFFIGQRELEMQHKMNTIIGQCRQKCQSMQEKFSEKLEQVHNAYQKMTKRCQMLEQENESLTNDKQQLQEKYAEKSRQKRKLDEMYDQLRSTYDSAKRSAIQPAANLFSRTEPNLFSGMGNLLDSRDPPRQDRSVFTPETPGRREETWSPARQKNSSSAAFDLSGGSPVKMAPVPIDARDRRSSRPTSGAGVNNPAATLRNLIISPMKRPGLSQNRSNLFTL